MAITFKTKKDASGAAATPASKEIIDKADVIMLPLKQSPHGWLQQTPLVVDALTCYRAMLGMLNPSCSYDEWFTIACASKSAGLSFEDFDEWSKKGYKYEAESSKALWNSISADGGISAGTLVHLAKQMGYVGPIPAKHSTAYPKVEKLLQKDTTPVKADELEKWFNSWPDASEDHAYLMKKAIPSLGLKTAVGQIGGTDVTGWVAVPVRTIDGSFCTVQFISPAGEKRNAPGQDSFGDGMHVIGAIGPTGVMFVAEGLASACSIFNADPSAAVITAFSIGRFGRVATALRAAYPHATLVLVPDKGAEETAHKVAATVSGYVVEMPNDAPPHYDAWDIEDEKGHQWLKAWLANRKKPMAPFEYERDGSKRNKIVPNVTNIIHALDEQPYMLRRDLFVDRIMIEHKSTGQRVELQETDYVKMQLQLEAMGFSTPTADRLRDCIRLVASENSFDSAIAWLEGLPAHDGVSRVERFLVDYFNVPDSPYARAVGRYLWSALAGRTLQPGVKADMMLVLVGEQGLVKSESIATLVPREDWFGEVDFGEREVETSRKMCGKLLCEVPELKGLSGRDVESIKAFASRRVEEFRWPYDRHLTRYLRRTLLIGSTNQTEFLADETGNRRWLPVTVGKVDIDGIRKVRDLLWSEGRKIFNTHGIQWKDAQNLAKSEHGQYLVSDDAWESAIEKWLASSPVNLPMSGGNSQGGGTNGENGFSMTEVATGALHFEEKNIKQSDQRRIARVLRKLGYENRQTWTAGKNRMLWQRKTP
nr:VapE domain-containing protein [Burkholderia ambifaria]